MIKIEKLLTSDIFMQPTYLYLRTFIYLNQSDQDDHSNDDEIMY